MHGGRTNLFASVNKHSWQLRLERDKQKTWQHQYAANTKGAGTEVKT
jgi:hypothetical protein